VYDLKAARHMIQQRAACLSDRLAQPASAAARVISQLAINNAAFAPPPQPPPHLLRLSLAECKTGNKTRYDVASVVFAYR